MDADQELTEEQKKAREARRRERERERERRGKDKSGRPSRRLDLIDQLDATSIYGTGCKLAWLIPFVGPRLIITSSSIPP
jgi:hypothetical protein